MNLHLLAALIADDPIVVTGMGVHCAAGADVDSLWRAVVSGEVSVDEVEFDGNTYPARVAPEIDFAKDARLRAGRRTDRSVQLALSAAVEAVDQAGVSGEGLSVIAGTSRGPQQQWSLAKAEMDSGKRLRPTMAATGTVACLSGLLAQQFGATAPGFTVSATCSSAANAIALAAQQLIFGEAEAVLAGGSDAPLHRLVMLGMESAGMLGSACRPFDTKRDGLVVGEGAGFLVLERQSAARSRGAEILGRLDGWATGIDVYGRTGIREDGSGLVDVLERSLALAGLRSEDVGYVNAHGTATELNDRVEAGVLRRMFGEAVPVSSTKGITGHCLGATPAIEAIIALRALWEGRVPATAGLEEVAAECDGIDLVAGAVRERSARFAVSESIGFWGYHACLVLGRPR
ncbi:MAG: 3-oxoacyl-[acyl-carrier-protein] synthase II [Verrucomicrobiales bacterium]|jgi:3-oxoacyl-[acyl-carrier-protein] synthase II